MYNILGTSSLFRKIDWNARAKFEWINNIEVEQKWSNNNFEKKKRKERPTIEWQHFHLLNFQIGGGLNEIVQNYNDSDRNVVRYIFLQWNPDPNIETCGTGWSCVEYFEEY